MKRPLLSLTSLCLTTFAAWSQEDPGAAQSIEIADIQRDKPVDFAKEIFPLLKQSCVACHNGTKGKAGLNLESPKAMIAGGDSGPSVVPGKSAESLLLTLAAHQDDPVMPPAKNKANAENFTPEELGLIKRWIDEGAKGEAVLATVTPTEWLVPQDHQYPVYHAKLSPDGRFVAAARANRVYIYDLHLGTLATTLSDPELAADPAYGGGRFAHRDFVQSMAFSAEGWLATGGFRTVKLWRPQAPLTAESLTALPEAITVTGSAADGRLALGDATGNVAIQQADGSFRQAKAHDGAVTALSWNDKANQVIAALGDQLYFLDAASGVTSRQVAHPGAAKGLVFQEDRLVSGAEDGQVRLWTQEENAEPRALAGHTGAVIGLAASGNNVVSGGVDGTLRLWSISEAKELRKVDHGAPLTALAASPDGKRWLTVGGSVAKLWNAEDGQLISELKTNAASLRSQQAVERALTVANQLVEARKKQVEESEKAWKDELEKTKAASVDEPKLRLTKEEKEKAVYTAQLIHEEAKQEIAEAGTAKADALAAVSEAEAAVKAGEKTLEESKGLYSTRLAQFQEVEAELKSRLDAHDRALAESNAALAKQLDAERVLTESLANLSSLETSGKSTTLEAIEKWLAEARARTPLFQAAQKDVTEARTAFMAPLTAKAAERDAAEQAVLAAEKDLQQTRQGVEQAQAKVNQAEEREKQVTEATAAKEKALAEAQKAFDDADKAHAQSLQNRELAVRLSQRAGEIHANAQALLASAESAVKQSTEALEAAKKTTDESAKTLLSATFSHDSKCVWLSGQDGGLYTFAAATGDVLDADPTAAAQHALLANESGLMGSSAKTLSRWHRHDRWELSRTLGAIADTSQFVDRVTSLAFSPTGAYLATGSGFPSRSGDFKIWRVADGQLVTDHPDAHSDTIVGMAFSPDGDYLATAATDRFAKVFRVADGSLIQTLEGHTNHVLGVAWRADGRVLATAGADSVVKLWDVEEKRQLQTIDGFGKEVTSIAFVGTTGTVVTSAGDNSLRFDKDRLDAKSYAFAADINAEGTVVIAGTQDSTVRAWQVKDKKLLLELPAPSAEIVKE